MDDSGDLSAADAGIRGTVLVERISADGFVESIHDAQSDDEGHWEVRGLPDGTYRVRWDPPIADDELAFTIPPGQTLRLDERETVTVVTTTVTITGGARLMDVNFGVPRRTAVAFAPALPASGTGPSDTVTSRNLAGALLIAGVVAAGIVITRRSRRAD
jgi:hypothetical protein